MFPHVFLLPQVFDILNGKPYEPEFTSDDLLAQGELQWKQVLLPSVVSVLLIKEAEGEPALSRVYCDSAVAYSESKDPGGMQRRLSGCDLPEPAGLLLTSGPGA